MINLTKDHCKLHTKMVGDFFSFLHTCLIEVIFVFACFKFLQFTAVLLKPITFYQFHAKLFHCFVFLVSDEQLVFEAKCFVLAEMLDEFNFPSIIHL